MLELLLLVGGYILGWKLGDKLWNKLKDLFHKDSLPPAM